MGKSVSEGCLVSTNQTFCDFREVHPDCRSRSVVRLVASWADSLCDCIILYHDIPHPFRCLKAQQSGYKALEDRVDKTDQDVYELLTSEDILFTDLRIISDPFGSICERVPLGYTR